VAAGLRGNGWADRLAYLGRLNYAHTYIQRVRKHSTTPRGLSARAGSSGACCSRWPMPPRSERVEKFRAKDYHVERAILDPELVGQMRDLLFSPQTFNDPYVTGWSHTGSPDDCAHPMLYMDPQRLFSSAPFLSICANPGIIAFCRVLGPAAAITWAWSWISNPTGASYQNQNWHRDSSEPLNFVRIFVPWKTSPRWKMAPPR
jgi:hypothetical protein